MTLEKRGHSAKQITGCDRNKLLTLGVAYWRPAKRTMIGRDDAIRSLVPATNKSHRERNNNIKQNIRCLNKKKKKKKTKKKKKKQKKNKKKEERRKKKEERRKKKEERRKKKEERRKKKEERRKM